MGEFKVAQPIAHMTSGLQRSREGLSAILCLSCEGLESEVQRSVTAYDMVFDIISPFIGNLKSDQEYRRHILYLKSNILDKV